MNKLQDTTLFFASTISGGLSLVLSHINGILQCIALLISIYSLILGLIKSRKNKKQNNKEKEF